MYQKTPQSFQSFSDIGEYQALEQVAQRFGTIRAGVKQIVRGQFWSYAQYLSAGSSQFAFFGTARGVGTNNGQLTNLPQAGSFGNNAFLLKQIRARLFINDWNINNYSGTNASTLYSDIIQGLTHGGVFELRISGKTYVQIPMPLLTIGCSDGRPQVKSAGFKALTLVEAAPNTWPGTLTGSIPWAELGEQQDQRHIISPSLFIKEYQNFEAVINYPSGLIPVIGTGVVNDTTNPLYIGLQFDGIVFKPVS